jgi:hypothetical protein
LWVWAGRSGAMSQQPPNRTPSTRRVKIERGVLGSWPMIILLLALASGVLYVGMMLWVTWKT